MSKAIYFMKILFPLLLVLVFIGLLTAVIVLSLSRESKENKQ